MFARLAPKAIHKVLAGGELTTQPVVESQDPTLEDELSHMMEESLEQANRFICLAKKYMTVA